MSPTLTLKTGEHEKSTFSYMEQRDAEIVQGGKTMKSRYPVIEAYDEGFEDAQSGFINDNPYNLDTESRWHASYEQGYIDGLEVK